MASITGGNEKTGAIRSFLSRIMGRSDLADSQEPYFVMDNQEGKITNQDVMKAEGILQKYKGGKAMLETRVIENEQWYRVRHWEYIRKAKSNKGDPEPASAWAFNAIVNKHADAMDNFPKPAALPKEQSDEQEAQMLSDVLPVVLDQCGFEDVYSDAWYSKLKHGTAVYFVPWDKDMYNGLGDVTIKEIDLLNIFWEPGVSNIQQSRNVFVIALVDDDLLKEQFPHYEGRGGSPTLDIGQYVYDDTVDTTGKTVVVDWYYRAKKDGTTLLQYCKFANGQVLYASENDTDRPTMPQADPMTGQPVMDPETGEPVMAEIGQSVAETGWYTDAVHPGRYPFVFDVLWPMKGSPAGFGVIDICRSPQLYIDKIDQAILKNAVVAARPRWFVRKDGKINEEEYADMSKDFVHFEGSGDPNESIFPIKAPTLNAMVESIRLNKVDEMKETVGNRDFQQGGTAGGVTAASAIAAMIETGSKTSRDQNKGSYRAYKQICDMVIERFRQFYTEDRFFRIQGPMGDNQYISYNNANIAMQQQGQDFGVDVGKRVPVFDIEIVPQRSSPFSVVAQNERAQSFYAAGFFNPQMADQALACLDMMDFDGIEKVRRKISENGTMFQMVQQLSQVTMMMAQQLDGMTGSQYTPQIAQMLGMQAPMAGMSDNGGQAPSKAHITDGQENPNVKTPQGARTHAARASAPA